MRTKFYLIFFILLLIFGSSSAQQKNAKSNRDTSKFDYAYWHSIADKKHYNDAERLEFMGWQISLHKENHKPYPLKDQVTASEISAVGSGQQKGYQQNLINALACSNIDFENNSTSGWTLTSGFHPSATQTPACCPTLGAQNLVTSGAGVDPFGGFPVVCPGGSYSLRLGNSATGAQADRIQQKFFVTPANANFTYKYAVVLNDGGHNADQQPFFLSEIIDSLGNQVTCTAYSVTAGNNINGFFTSSLQANGNQVIYKPWTTVAVDLSPNIGQNVTLRFTTFDCSLGGHFGYAYLDGICTNFATSVADTTCPNIPIQMCGPQGFGSYSWNGPGTVNNPGQCINVSAPGVYTCQTVLVPGCPGPTFTHTLTNLPSPVLTFTPTTPFPCSFQYTFSSTSSISAGSIASYSWNLGNNVTSNVQSPALNYTASGTYPIKFRATSNRGCSDSVTKNITIFPFPVLAYSPPSNCINTVVQFTNSSTIAVGTISSYTWNLGNGVFSNLVNPTNTYTTNGTYNVTLSATSNQGCVSNLSSTLGIFPPPVLTFTAANFCQGNTTQFSSSVTIASGSIVSSSWSFGDGGTSTLTSPGHIYPAYGNYTTTFTAISNHFCVNTLTNNITINPNPVLSYSPTAVCLTNVTNFTNTSTIPLGTINSYTWAFGDGSPVSTVTNPAHTYLGPGVYSTTLTGTSNAGCVSTLVQTLSVYPFPNISFSPPSSCVNTPITYTNTSSIVSGSISAYAWDFGNGNTSSQANPVNTYTAPGAYVVTLTATSDMGCTKTVTNALTIWPEPNVLISTANYCFGNSTAFTNTSVIASGSISSYNWNFGDGSSSSASTTTHVYPLSGNYIVTFTATSNNGCIKTQSTAITINPLPNISFTGNNACPSFATNFTNNSTISAGSLSTYTWNFGDGSALSNLISPSHIYTLSNVYTPTLSITSNQGCSSSGTVNITIHPLPVVAFSPPGSCANSVIQFTNQSTIASGAITSYLWDFGNGATSAQINPVYSYSANGAYTIFLTATSNQGCVVTSTNNLTIYPLPSISFTASSICFGNVTAFSNTNGITSGSVVTFNWTFGDGGTSVSPNPSHTYTVDNNYLVTLSATSNSGCVTTSTQNITIHPLPQVSFTNNTVCLNNVTNFTESSTISAGSIVGWNWTFGDGGTSNFQNTIHTYTSSGTFTTTLTATSAQNCTSSATHSVVIHPLPNLTFNPPGACVNTVIQFTNTSTVATGSISSYFWDFGNGTTSNFVNPTYGYTVPATYIVTLTATTDKGCVKTATNSVDIYPYPTATIVPLNTSCINNVMNFNPNIAISGANASMSFTWSFGDGSPLVQSPSLGLTIPHTYTAYNTYTFTIIAKSNNNCASTYTSTAIVYPKPFPLFAPTKFCFKDSTTFANISTIPTGSITDHYWHFGNGNVTSALKNPKHRYTAPGTYTVSLTEFSYPAPGLTCSMTGVSTVTINPLPQPTFTNNSVCPGTPTSFTNTTSSPNIIGWTWDFDNDGFANSAAPNPTFTYPAGTGTYVAKLIALNSFGCRDTITNVVSVFPSPTPSFVSNSACLGDPTSFINQTSPPNGNTYAWSIANQNFSTNKDPIFTFTTAGVFTVQLTSTSNLGCSSKYSSSVTVFALPNVNFSATDACLGKPTVFINSTTPAPSIQKWLWDLDNNGIWDDSTQGPAPKIYPTAGAVVIKLKAIDNNQCTATKTVNIFVHGNPVANFNHSPLVCAGDKIYFTNLSTSSDGTVTSYAWDFDGDNFYENYDTNPSFTYSLPGIYVATMRMISQYACTDLKTLTITANPKPLAGFTSDKFEGCPSLCVSFKNQSSVVTGSITNMDWDFGDGSPLANFADPSHCFNSGSYDITLRLTTDKGCKTTLTNKSYITVFNNPVAGFKVDPPEVDEDEPIINVTTEATDATYTRYYVSDGNSYGGEHFAHTFKNLENKTKPMVVQIVRSKNGCADTLYKVLDIKPAFVIYFPNVFTPNSDFTNDGFQAKGVGIIKFAMQIYDRWGHQVFQTRDINIPWDGRSRGSEEPIKQDVYIWKAQVTDIFNKTHDYVGHVSLIK